MIDLHKKPDCSYNQDSGTGLFFLNAIPEEVRLMDPPKLEVVRCFSSDGGPIWICQNGNGGLVAFWRVDRFNLVEDLCYIACPLNTVVMRKSGSLPGIFVFAFIQGFRPHAGTLVIGHQNEGDFEVEENRNGLTMDFDPHLAAQALLQELDGKSTTWEEYHKHRLVKPQLVPEES